MLSSGKSERDETVKEFNILSLSNSTWTYPYWTSRQFLTYELAKHARVIYATAREDLREVVGRLRLGTNSRDQAPFPPPLGLELLSSKWPRTYRFTRADQSLAWAYTRRLQRCFDRHCTNNIQRVLYIWDPGFLDTIKRLSYDILVYHPYDMFREFVTSGDEIAQREEEICRLADAVITPHRRVADTLGHANSHIVNNGVFLPAFPSRQSIEIPYILRDIGRPLIGYVGAINNKVDFGLLLHVFSARPEWRLVLVGFEGPGSWKESSAYRDLRALPNVRFLGPLPIQRVAAVMAGLDVGVIPYSLSGWARYSESPLKLYQYWAMGVPVVCTPLPNLEPVPGALEIGRTPEDWATGIEAQLARIDPNLHLSLRRRAKEFDWGVKARQVIEILCTI